MYLLKVLQSIDYITVFLKTRSARLQNNTAISVYTDLIFRIVSRDATKTTKSFEECQRGPGMEVDHEISELFKEYQHAGYLNDLDKQIQALASLKRDDSKQ